jgi:hypothetical protein
MNFKNGFLSYGLGWLLGNPHLKHTPQKRRSQRKGARKSYSKFTKIRNKNYKRELSGESPSADACLDSTIPDARLDSATGRIVFFPVMPCSFSRSASSQSVLTAARFDQREIFTLQVVQFFFTIAPNTISWGPISRERIYHTKSYGPARPNTGISEKNP